MSSEQPPRMLQSVERVFRPLPQTVTEANVNPKQYVEAMRRGGEDPEGFWREAAEELDWFRKWDRVLDSSKAPPWRWFAGAKCNIAFNALDRHIETWRKNKLALIWEGEPGDRRKLTYYELYREVNKFANVLRSLDVKPGDRVGLYLPNIPEAAVAMLACAKVGAIHVAVFSGFSAPALRERINAAGVKLFICADGLWRHGQVINLRQRVDAAMIECPAVETVIVVHRAGEGGAMSDGRYLWYHDLMDGECPEAETEVLDAQDTLFILYSSGNSGRLRGVMHCHGGYMVGIHRSLKWVFDLKETDIYWCAGDVGWIAGHSCVLYGPLIAGTTTVMYEGHPLHPKADRMWQLIDKYGINILCTTPTTVRMLMRFGSRLPARYDLSTLRLLGTTCEPLGPEAWAWLYEHVGRENCPIIDTWWQTETGMFMVAPLPVSLLKPGSAARPFPGVDVDVVDAAGRRRGPGEVGQVVVRRPWPAMFQGLWNEPAEYGACWDDGCYLSGDTAIRDADGYFWFQGRSEGVLNIGGYRIGTAEIERALTAHKAVARAAVVATPDKIKGETAKAFVVLESGAAGDDELINELKRHVAQELGPIVVLKSVQFVGSLPRSSAHPGAAEAAGREALKLT